MRKQDFFNSVAGLIMIIVIFTILSMLTPISTPSLSSKGQSDNKSHKEVTTEISTITEITSYQLVESSLVEETSGVDYKLLARFPKEPRFILGNLDHLGRPTYAHIQFHNFIDATSPDYKDPDVRINGETGYRTDYLPGYQGNPDFVIEDLGNGRVRRGPVWHPQDLLSASWTDYRYNNRAQNYALLTTYASQGYDDYSTENPTFRPLSYYEGQLTDWLSDSSKDLDFIDYRIELLYQDHELVPRQVKISYVGLTESGSLRKIDLDGTESFDEHGIATVIIDNIAPNVTIDYLTGKVQGNLYVPVEVTTTADNTDYVSEYEDEVYVDWVTGEYYYDIPFNASEPDKMIYYEEMSEEEAVEEGYYSVE